MSKLIALCGIDGTGKSTQAALLEERLQDMGSSTEVLWCRWDPLIARPAIWLLSCLANWRSGSGVASNTDNGSGDRRRALKRRLLSAAIVRRMWTGVMVLDYGLQIGPKVAMARRRADLVIVDRYRHDVLIDLSAGGELADTPRSLRWLLPEPALIIVLDVDEKIALARKPDSLDLTYLEDRRRLYKQLAKAPNAILIEASEPTEVVSKAVLAAMVSNSICTEA